MPSAPLRAVIWIAVSTKEQATSDKESLTAQERDAREVCEKNGWNITALLIVPGHSRRFVDIHDAARDMRKEGIDAFDRLLSLWDQSAFDVLVVRDADRFARTQSLHAYVVERTINIGARIYSLKDGWVDQQNYRMWISMAGYRAASEMEGFQRRRSDSLHARVSRGLPRAKILLSHKLVRDPQTGKALRLDLDEDKQRLLHDAALLLLEGVPWQRIELQLYKRFGHANPKTGRPYPNEAFYKLCYNPWFWGHSAVGFRIVGADRCGPWAYDPAIPLPVGVEIWRDTHPAAFTGELATQVMAEMRRREGIRGSASPAGRYPFTGIMICGTCGKAMIVAVATPKHYNPTRRQYVHYRCNTHNRKYYVLGATCANIKYIKQSKVQAYVNALLLELQRGSSSVPLFPELPAPDRVALLEQEIHALEGQIREMIIGSTRPTSPAVQTLYNEQIVIAGERLDTLKANLQEARQRVDTLEQATRQQREMLGILSKLDLETFWTWEGREINQFLHRLFGKAKLVVQDGTIIGLRRP